MNRSWYLVAAGVGAGATMILAARHELGWTIAGIVSVGCNIFNYLNERKNKDV